MYVHLHVCSAMLYACSRNFQRLLLVTLMLAAKTYDDFYYSNAVWAKVCAREALFRGSKPGDCGL